MLIFLTLPLSGLFAWNYFLVFRRIIGGFRIRNLIRKNNRKFRELKNSYTELINLVSGMMDKDG
jgi:hypothetical protein